MLEEVFRIKELIKILNEATVAYDLNENIMTDAEWDKLYFELKDLEQKTNIIYPNSPTQMVFYDVVNELKKVEHNHPMLSLDKTKDWYEFLRYFGDHSLVAMLKLDGLTCSLRYLDGKLVSAETRGNGKVGEDVTHNIRVLKNVPQIIPFKGEYVVDGEVICTYQDFEKFKGEYANPRNFAAGSIRLLSASECAKRKLRFVVWNVVKGRVSNSVWNELETAYNMGFEVVPHLNCWDLDAKEFLIDLAKEEGYPIDGLVGRFDDIFYGEMLGATDHHSRAAYAFKFEDEKYDTKLINIDWTMGRTGVLTPVAVFEPTDTGDNIVERANLHNLSIMEELLDVPYVGQPIKFYLANQIIPQIAEAHKSGLVPNGTMMIEPPHICPICGGSTAIKEENNILYLICDNPNCEGKLINKLDHFLGKKGLDIKGISKATLEKLVDWGWVNNFADLFNLSQYRQEWINKAGFGPASVDKVLNALENGKRVPLQNFIAAIGIPMIGKSLSNDLVNYIESYEDFRDKIENKYSWSELNNFAEIKWNNLINFNYSEADAVAAVLDIYKEEKEPVGASLEGKVFVITGRLMEHKNRDELVAKIVAAGGKVVSGISAKVNYLINNDVTSTSAKNLAAQKLGIPVISELDLLTMI